MRFPLFPPAASGAAHQVDALVVYLVVTCGVFLLAIAFVMTYFLLKYRRGKPANREARTFSSTPFEIAWSVVPLAIFVSFFYWGAKLYFTQETPPSDAIEIHVIGKQWMWKVQYPNGRREINELHVPVDRDIKLVLATEDVIHSFFVPAFRTKQDAVPGRYTTLWFKADELGTFPFFCAEYCGTGHSSMIGQVTVMTPSDYARWLSAGAPAAPLEARGARLFRELGCSGCHGPHSVVHAPPLEGLYGRPVPLSTGKVVDADDAYVHDSILYPKKQVAAGYQDIMPSFEGQISEEQVFELVAYIRSLADQKPVQGTPNP